MAPRDDVIDAQLGRRETLAAVLTSVAVAGVNVTPIELDLLLRQAIVDQEPDDARDGDRETDRANPIVLLGLELFPQFADLTPAFKIVGKILTVLDMDDFGHVSAEQRKRSPNVDHADRQIVLVKNKDVAAQPRDRCR